MNCFSIAYNNFRHNVKVYALHIMAMIFSVSIYYNFIAIKYHPQIMSLKQAMDTMRETTIAASTLLLVFLIFFIWFSNSFFLNQKKKEIGIYAFAGIDNYKIGLIFAIESFLLGIVSIVSGIFVGILFSKLFVMLLSKVAYLDIKLRFFVSIKAVFETTVTFLIIFLAISVLSYVNIVRSKLIDLFNASKKHEGILKINYFKAIASVLIIGTVYLMCAKLQRLTVIAYIPIITILTILGTYWLFGGFLPMIMRHIINKKNILYKGTNVISMSNINFRIKGNYITLATIAILIASAITAFGTVTSIKYTMGSLDLDLPYSFTYEIEGKEDKIMKDKVDKVLNESNHNVLLKEKANFVLINKYKTNYDFYGEKLVVTKVSDFKKISKDLKVKNYEEIVKKSDLLNGECIYIERPKVAISAVKAPGGKKFHIGNLSYKVKSELKTPLFGGGINAVTIVVSDLDYNNIKKQFKEYEFNGIIVDNQEKSMDLAMGLKNIKHIDNKLYSFAEKYRAGYKPYGIIFFMGSILALVFVLATGSVIHFKILSEAFMDKIKYDILMKIGITEKELIKVISNQVLIYFILPLIVGVVHSCAAILILGRLINYNLLIPTAISIITFVIIYGIFYVFTVIKFRKIVY